MPALCKAKQSDMKLQYLNYKEPLTPCPDGHGYLGTLAQTENGEKVQCHICGELCYNLGAHAFNKHQIRASEYREKFQLGRRTPLCSDKATQDYKNSATARYTALSDDEKRARIESMKAAAQKATRVGQPHSLESLNKNGMCPDQLIARIVECAEAIGESPTHEQFKAHFAGKYVGAIVRTFGTWNAAKKQANLAPNKPGSRTPWNKGKSRYTDEMLLEYVRNRREMTGTWPTSSDWRRGFLPDYHIYLQRFGSMQGIRTAVENSSQPTSNAV